MCLELIKLLSRGRVVAFTGFKGVCVCGNVLEFSPPK